MNSQLKFRNSNPQLKPTTMNNFFSGRTISFLGLILGIASLLFAIVYLQMIEYLAPCSLCILDRAVVIGLCIVFTIALIHNPIAAGRKIYASLATLLSLTGIAICARHIWLQQQPKDAVPECGPGFWHMLENMPFKSFLDKIFNSSGDCADIQFQLLGLSLPALTLILFVVFLLLSLAMYFTSGSKHLPDTRQQHR